MWLVSLSTSSREPQFLEREGILYGGDETDFLIFFMEDGVERVFG
jgi:hypothetical protein